MYKMCSQEIIAITFAYSLRADIVQGKQHERGSQAAGLQLESAAPTETFFKSD